MINQIQTVITALSTFPDRPNYESARAYATAVATWLRENKELSEALSTLIPELNTVLEQINSTTQNIQEIEEHTEQLKQDTQAIKNSAIQNIEDLNSQNIENMNTIKNDTKVFKETTENIKTLVEKYANEDEDIEVEESKYSSLHYYLKTLAISATLMEGSINNTIKGENSTYSSSMIEDLLNLKADKTEVELNRLEKTASIEPSIEVNPTTSLFYSITVDANVSFSFAGYSTQKMKQVIVELENAGSYAVTFTGVNWVKLDGTFGTTIADVGLSLQATGKDYLLFFSPNGTDIAGKVLR